MNASNEKAAKAMADALLAVIADYEDKARPGQVSQASINMAKRAMFMLKDPNDAFSRGTSRCDHGVPMGEPCEKCGKVVVYFWKGTSVASKRVKRVVRFEGKPMLFGSAAIAKQFCAETFGMKADDIAEIRSATAKQLRDGTTNGQ
jgi:hypothetical protein